MERRKALKDLLLYAGGTIFLTACMNGDKKVSIPLDHLQLSADEEAWLAELADALIPKTDTPGAKELGVHQFVAVMVDDCYDEPAQKKFMKGLQTAGPAFIKASPEQREQLLQKMEKKELGEEVAFFYSLLKSLTIQGYMKSKYVMSNLLVYQLVPGHFYGSMPVNKLTRFEQNG